MKTSKSVMVDLCMLAGLACIVYGVYLYGGPPPAFIVSGVFMCVVGWLYLSADRDEGEPE